MTDITELAQSLKAAAEKATQGNWRAFQYHDGRCGIGGGHNNEIMVCEHISKERQHDAMFIALANPANILALVEALEKAQKRIVELSEGKVGSALLERENHHVEMVWKLTEHITELESEVEKWKQEAEVWEQVAEKQLATAIKLEWRTVTFKLPSTPEPSASAPLVAKAFYQFHKDTVKSCVAVFSDACAAAGIKVEAE